jgi:hypothetical protein
LNAVKAAVMWLGEQQEDIWSQINLMCDWIHDTFPSSHYYGWEDVKQELNGVFKGNIFSTLSEFQGSISQPVKNIHDHQQQMLTWDQKKGFNWLNP